jgi:hypothetical protein
MNVAIFLFGVLVMAITLFAVFLLGLSEAADPSLSRPEDLTKLERYLVGRERADKTSDDK